MNPRAPVLAAVLGVVVLAAALYFGRSMPAPPGGAGMSASTTPSTLGIPGASPVAPLIAPRTPPSGELEYRDSTYRFSLFYPQDLTVSTHDDGGGASTFVFQDPKQGLGFQIFVVPYGSKEISQARFLEDEPSGVRFDATSTAIDGVEAVSFYGKNATLGETAEVWFIKDGYLYEILAPKVLAGWLGGIMATWQFI